ncbi:Rieske (2Fe-2S) protein [Geobacter pelophilus]|uniref:Rieske (2Fe-2S) protein n=1 Tax=Geoanaerobacter pelophilus TaxID=60036 RepID=A0AAW4L705_9BACT|nr:Rieske (2Fe-2S) protein [Geoanaerobacter pelophilus]MBT0666584.1 Rieske (2Fe-2S) protein [Geoanaerobacter pelophilus]
MENRDRRKFLGVCLGGIASASIAAVAYPLFRYLSPIPEQENSGKVTFQESDIPEGEAKFFQYAGSAAVLIKNKEQGVIALSAVCTHLGCIVQWQKERGEFLCPCHAGRYTAQGLVISGPPPKPLQPLHVSIANGTITIG